MIGLCVDPVRPCKPLKDNRQYKSTNKVPVPLPHNIQHDILEELTITIKDTAAISSGSMHVANFAPA